MQFIFSNSYCVVCTFYQIIFFDMTSTFPSLLEASSKKASFFAFSKTFSQPPLIKLQSNSSQKSKASLLEDISNQRIKQIIMSHKNIKGLLDATADTELIKKHNEEIKDNQLFLKQYEQRRWLTKKGKKYLIDFDNEERKQMKLYFNSLDQKKCGFIGIDELQELMLSIGLFETREQVKSLIDSVDQGKSGKIQFDEFLSMIQSDQGQNEEIVSFFKTVIGDKFKQLKLNRQYSSLKSQNNSRYFQKNIPQSNISQMIQKYPYPKGLSFEMVVSHIRRKHMMTALNIGRPNKKQDQISSQYLSQGNLGNYVNYDHSVEHIAKGQRVMLALQKMYERKLIRQIKQSKRASHPGYSIGAANKEDYVKRFKSIELKRLSSTDAWLNSVTGFKN